MPGVLKGAASGHALDGHAHGPGSHRVKAPGRIRPQPGTVEGAQPVSITITDELITSDRTKHVAMRDPEYL